jgi:zinc protease
MNVRPELGPQPKIAVPKVTERVLANGLRVAAVRRAGVPLVEVRLRLPFAGTTRAHLAATSVLTETMFAGTPERDAEGIAAAVQALGGSLGAGADADRLAVSGSALAENLGPLLNLLAEVLGSAAYPADEVDGERERLVEEIAIALTTPSTLAGEALAHRAFGRHPYAWGLPTPDEVRAVTPAALRRLHASRIGPAAALLVIVGDVAPGKALDAAEAALGDWSAQGRKTVSMSVPPAFAPGGIALLDRPDSVQTCLRMIGLGPARSDPDHAALVAANTVFAGYFSSRLVANIREDKGYTYSPHAGLDHAALATTLTISADVATEVTAPALVETSYELAKVAALPVTQAELEAARRYLVGTLALSTSSQAGLATTLARLIDAGPGSAYLRDYPAALAKVTVDSAYEAARRWLAPSAMATVLVGDATVIGPSVAALGTVTPMTLA